MDLAAIAAALGSIKTATDIAKLIKDSDVSLEKAEAKLKLAELISALADTKIQIAEIQQFLIDKDTELRAIKEQLDVKAKLQWESPYYWLLDETQKDGPYCQHCYDKDNLLIRLQGNGAGYWRCSVCKNSYTDSNYQPPPPRRTTSSRNIRW
jgi:ribosomal protein L37AE/L43A